MLFRKIETMGTQAGWGGCLLQMGIRGYYTQKLEYFKCCRLHVSALKSTKVYFDFDSLEK